VTLARIASPARIPVTATKPISVWKVADFTLGTRPAAAFINAQIWSSEYR